MKPAKTLPKKVRGGKKVHGRRARQRWWRVKLEEEEEEKHRGLSPKTESIKCNLDYMGWHTFRYHVRMTDGTLKVINNGCVTDERADKELPYFTSYYAKLCPLSYTDKSKTGVNVLVHPDNVINVPGASCHLMQQDQELEFQRTQFYEDDGFGITWCTRP